jgi:hypothetical protein
MVLYLYFLFISLLILYMIPLVKIRWNIDYFRELEKQCL